MAPRFPHLITRIAEAVRDQGGVALLVGGSVRDSLLDESPSDYDLEVYGVAPESLGPLLTPLGFEWAQVVGQSFPILKGRLGGVEVDVAIPRRSNPRSGPRTGEFEGDPDLAPEEAARRRDFTVNAMALNILTGEILDFFNGQQDLRDRILRVVDRETFREDPLRVLRAMQLAGRYGFSVEPGTVAICRELTTEPAFAALINSRVGGEWRKLLLTSERPSVGLAVGLALGAFDALHPELVTLVDCQQDPGWHPEGDVWTHTLMVVDVAAQIIRREGLVGDDALVIMLGALCHDLGKPAVTVFEADRTGVSRWRSREHEDAGIEPTRSFLARMEFGHNVEERVVRLVADHLAPVALFPNGRPPRDAAVGRLASRLEPATMRELVWVSEADQRGRATPDRGFADGVTLLDIAARLRVSDAGPAPLLMGRHLLDLGWKPGPTFQPVLAAAYEAQLDGDITTLEQAIDLAKGLNPTT